jgi:hypothetical protein
LGCGTQGELQWDAILAPLGSPLPEFTRSEGALAWREARLLLDELAGELTAAIADGTLPASLTVEQVWVQPDGRAQLADLPLTATPPEEDHAEGSPQERALKLLARVLVLALEGKPRPSQVSAAPLRLTLPPDARQVCERLLGIGKQYDTVQQFQECLGRGAER